MIETAHAGTLTLGGGVTSELGFLAFLSVNMYCLYNKDLKCGTGEMLSG